MEAAVLSQKQGAELVRVNALLLHSSRHLILHNANYAYFMANGLAKIGATSHSTDCPVAELREINTETSKGCKT